MNEQICGNCRFHSRLGGLSIECRRYPDPVNVINSYWCGEYQSAQCKLAEPEPEPLFKDSRSMTTEEAEATESGKWKA